mmetsp:Transcript_22611/g.33065  ORF Transcript_22611/g.33065 Transcript_22611/m.33065 type:complete len:233 (+) Transcript_22611:91-789(+)
MMDKIITTLISTARNRKSEKIDAPIKSSDESDPFNSLAVDDNSVLFRKTLAIVGGKQTYVRRAYIRSSVLSSYRHIGWVLDSDVDKCMVCATKFSFFTRKHHCRGCGNIICNQCSPDRIRIREYREYGPVRICRLCYFGQEELSVVPRNSEDSSLSGEVPVPQSETRRMEIIPQLNSSQSFESDDINGSSISDSVQDVVRRETEIHVFLVLQLVVYIALYYMILKNNQSNAK